jgi:hypothetical protein
MFALSYRVTLGSHVLLQLPLSDSMVLALSTFRASGRFFWPVGYALVTLAVITVATRLRPAVATLILLTACVLQLIDISPLRTAIARSAVAPPAPIIDRHQAAALAADVGALALFPSFGCVPVADPPTSAEIYREDLLHHLAMEFQLIAARRNLTINSVYNARLRTDCVAEAIIRREPLRASILYVYLDGALPDAAQFGGADPAKICQALGSIRACKLTNDHDGVIR